MRILLIATILMFSCVSPYYENPILYHGTVKDYPCILTVETTSELKACIDADQIPYTHIPMPVQGWNQEMKRNEPSAPSLYYKSGNLMLPAPDGNFDKDYMPCYMPSGSNLIICP